MGGGTSKSQDDKSTQEINNKQEEGTAKIETVESEAEKTLKKKKSVLAVEMQIERVASVLNQLSPKSQANFRNALADTDPHPMIIESYVDDDHAHSGRSISTEYLSADRQKVGVVPEGKDMGDQDQSEDVAEDTNGETKKSEAETGDVVKDIEDVIEAVAPETANSSDTKETAEAKSEGAQADGRAGDYLANAEDAVLDDIDDAQKEEQ